MNRDFIVKHWYASVYEQFENQTHDVAFLLKVLKEQTDGKPQNILEVACGGGRICVPLAQAGHNVTGFDKDEQMLLRCYHRMQGLKNLRCYQADAVSEDWGSGFDVVVLAGNILINIQTEMAYMEAQKLFIEKAAKALRCGGHLYLDFDLHYNPKAVFSDTGEGSFFEGTDDFGTFGRIVCCGSVYDPVTQLCIGTDHWELTTNNGEKMIIPDRWYKHIPTQQQVYSWLAEAGFNIERTYLNFTEKPIPVPIPEETYRATIWARKD